VPKPRSEARDKAFEIWAKSRGKKKLVDIARELGVPDSKVRKWKSADKWSEKLKSVPKGAAKTRAPNDTKTTAEKPRRKRGAPLGNKNSVGHRPSSPLRNTNAVRTGENQTIWLDTMTEEEKALYSGAVLDPVAALDDEIRKLEIRELRMTRQLLAMKQQYADTESEGDLLGTISETVIEKDKDGGVQQVTKHRQAADKLIEMENAITRVQEKKINAIERKAKIQINQELLRLKERLVKHKEEWG